MFRGDHLELSQVIRQAIALARSLEHPRTGSEHLLLALAAGSSVAAVLANRGAAEETIRQAVLLAAPAGAGAAADRAALAPLGIDLQRLAGTVLDRPPVREPLLPLGMAEARRRCARQKPPLGLDAQAAYEASLRLALARREREHRPEHLAFVLVTLDPGTSWILDAAGIDQRALLADLAAAFPAPRRNPVLRAERRLGQRVRHRDLVRRYQHTTGRTVSAEDTVAALIVH